MSPEQLAIIQKHRDDCKMLHQLYDKAVTTEDWEFCLLSAETIALIHSGERIAWGIDSGTVSLEFYQKCLAEKFRRMQASDAQA